LPNNSPPSLQVKAKKKPVRKKVKALSTSTLLDRFLLELEATNYNATEAMMRVSNAKSRSSAAAMATIYMQRAQELGRLTLEKKGYGLGKLIDVAIRKMEFSETPEWWDRLFKIAGYGKFMESQGPTKQAITVLQVQKSLIDDYIEGETV
jgi:hypothetical protein